MGRRQIEDSVRELALPIAAERGLEIFDVEYVHQQGTWILRVFIDHPQGIDVEDCQAVSDALSERLDTADPIPGSYALEVSSPGAERPLRGPEDYRRFTGQQVQVTTYAPVEGRKVWRGRLVGLQDDRIVVADGNDRHVSIPVNQVAKARLVLEW